MASVRVPARPPSASAPKPPSTPARPSARHREAAARAARCRPHLAGPPQPPPPGRRPLPPQPLLCHLAPRPRPPNRPRRSRRRFRRQHNRGLLQRCQRRRRRHRQRHQRRRRRHRQRHQRRRWRHRCPRRLHRHWAVETSTRDPSRRPRGPPPAAVAPFASEHRPLQRHHPQRHCHWGGCRRGCWSLGAREHPGRPSTNRAHHPHFRHLSSHGSFHPPSARQHPPAPPSSCSSPRRAARCRGFRPLRGASASRPRFRTPGPPNDLSSPSRRRPR
mmetsp:Transcript_41326/g.133174  ORF Transcript_41326/g.133174 Transcript_41326/m.133174 type:complete len:274 (-) Transcript_41326:258-1079(-)